ncbi:hypothetical protein BDA99DRAFT_533936 [Phascolomyces articulosus]|uniref:Uncharacterized protein n=1 Tax=Phascolomyces articulosus TaxID=60185 RepID=A0AAD5K8D9_9FUNG|nr:hypothetical protein BDA99DRAFT_533936 [Phascolomyces articulosus]
MSASVAHLPTQYHLLPMPTGIGIDDSFSRDLLRQFDRRRSRLHVEMAQLENRHSIHIIPITPSPTSSTSHHSSHHQNGQPNLPPEDEPLEQRRQLQQEREELVRRRSSAGELLRRSSAYLRAKWRILRSEESNFSTASLPAPPSKIAINTTISIPHFHNSNNNTINNSNSQQQQLPSAIHYATVQPPVITQYPPKPLVYAPVEPMEDVYQEDHHQQQQKQRKALHRISLPILSVHRNKSLIDKKKKRRFSDSVDHHQHQQQQRSIVGTSCDTIGQRAKKWTQFINCRPLKKSRKGKERVTLTTTTTSNGAITEQQPYSS